MKKLILALMVALNVVAQSTNKEPAETEPDKSVKQIYVHEKRGTNCLISVFSPKAQKFWVFLGNAPETLWKDIPDFTREKQYLNREADYIHRIESSGTTKRELAKSAYEAARIRSIANDQPMVTPKIYNDACDEYLRTRRAMGINGEKYAYLSRLEIAAENNAPVHHIVPALAKFSGRIATNGIPIWEMPKTNRFGKIL